MKRALAITLFLLAGVAKADTITLTCIATDVDCPNVIFGGSYQGFSILHMPKQVSLFYSTPTDLIWTLGDGGIFDYNGAQFSFGNGWLKEEHTGYEQLYTPELTAYYDPSFFIRGRYPELGITFDPPSETPEPSTAILLFTGLSAIGMMRRKRC